MSTLRCKPGDLAVVIGVGALEDGKLLLGACVTVLELMKPGEVVQGLGCRWRVVRDDTWMCESSDGCGSLITDSLLMPIKPEPDPEEQLHQVEVPTS